MAARSGTTSSTPPGAVRDGATADPGARQLSPLVRGCRAPEGARRRSLPILHLVGARAARRRALRPCRPDSTTTGDWRTTFSRQGSRRSRRCTTGISRAPWRRSGGWLERDTALRFGEYAEIVAEALGDRIRHWYTVNEPVSTSLQGYAVGELAPARQLLFGSLPTVHHQLLAHGLAVARAARPRRRGGRASSTTTRSSIPASDSAEDAAAAAVYDLLHNRIFADPDPHRGVSRSRGLRHPADAGPGGRPRADRAPRATSTA